MRCEILVAPTALGAVRTVVAAVACGVAYRAWHSAERNG